VEVIAPQLQVEVAGPRLRYLERQAAYEVKISNPGTASARDVEVVAILPRGLKFVSAAKHGEYDPQSHAVYWSLEELPPNNAGVAELVTLPVVEGEHNLVVKAREMLTAAQPYEHRVTIQGVADPFFTVVNTADPIEVGSETSFQIDLTNQGSLADTQVVVAIEFPPELQPVKADGPSEARVQGQTVIFQPLPTLDPKQDVRYVVRAVGRAAGDPRVSVRVSSAHWSQPVAKEESVKVYTDESLGQAAP
jgi:hypothetical protein